MDQIKQKSCRVCKKDFIPYLTTQVVCKPKCAVKLVAIKRKEKEAKAKHNLKLRKEALKTRSDWLKDTQKAFNAYIRTRDEGQACISCDITNPGEHHVGGSWDCGHYRSVGSAPELRFNPMNAYRQCKQCNNQRSGNHIEYRQKLKMLIGEKNLEWLEGKHEPQKWSINDLKEMIQHFRFLTKVIKEQR